VGTAPGVHVSRYLCMSADARARALVTAAVTAAGAAHVPDLLLLWGAAPWLCCAGVQGGKFGSIMEPS
jgi:hypothetical protein